MDMRRLAAGFPVEWLGEDNEPDADEGWLRKGHPGRITDPAAEDVFVEWFGLENRGVSRWLCYDFQALGELDEGEYRQRCERIGDGLAPLR
jgi:hypothetical protein